jgi:hypothetical protein
MEKANENGEGWRMVRRRGVRGVPCGIGGIMWVFEEGWARRLPLGMFGG